EYEVDPGGIERNMNFCRFGRFSKNFFSPSRTGIGLTVQRTQCTLRARKGGCLFKHVRSYYLRCLPTGNMDAALPARYHDDSDGRARRLFEPGRVLICGLRRRRAE